MIGSGGQRLAPAARGSGYNYNRSENVTLQCRAQRGSTRFVCVVVFYVETAGQATCDSNDFHGHFLLLRVYGSICLSADTEHALL